LGGTPQLASMVLLVVGMDRRVGRGTVLPLMNEAVGEGPARAEKVVTAGSVAYFLATASIILIGKH
jgi:hypothetical protein